MKRYAIFAALGPLVSSWLSHRALDEPAMA
jgi:hypothetical protein